MTDVGVCCTRDNMGNMLSRIRLIAARVAGVFHRLLAFGDVPNQPKTPTHSVRVPQELWDAVRAKAKRQGETITDVILRALKAYLRD